MSYAVHHRIGILLFMIIAGLTTGCLLSSISHPATSQNSASRSSFTQVIPTTLFLETRTGTQAPQTAQNNVATPIPSRTPEPALNTFLLDSGDLPEGFQLKKVDLAYTDGIYTAGQDFSNGNTSVLVRAFLMNQPYEPDELIVSDFNEVDVPDIGDASKGYEEDFLVQLGFIKENAMVLVQILNHETKETYQSIENAVQLAQSIETRFPAALYRPDIKVPGGVFNNTVSAQLIKRSELLKGEFQIGQPELTPVTQFSNADQIHCLGIELNQKISDYTIAIYDQDTARYIRSSFYPGETVEFSLGACTPPGSLPDGHYSIHFWAGQTLVIDKPFIVGNP